MSRLAREVFSPKGLLFPFLLMLAVPGLMLLTFPIGRERSLGLYGIALVRSFVWASWTPQLFWPPFGYVVHTPVDSLEKPSHIFAWDAMLFSAFGLAIYWALTRKAIPKRRAAWAAVTWAVCLVQLLGAALTSFVAFAGS